METYDLAVLGLGSSAAYYLSTFDKSREYLETIVNGKSKTTKSWFITTIVAIGLEDPWAGARGHNENMASQFVNHTYHLIKHNGDTVAKYTDEKNLVDRKQWAKDNAAIIKKVSNAVIKAKIKNVEPSVAHPDPHMAGTKYFRITTDAADTNDVIYARKVVVATGAGVAGKGTEFHQRPDWVTKGVTDGVPADKVMDMDEFVRGDAEKGQLFDGRNQTAIVFGHNAGIDAAEDAYDRKFTVRWLGTADPIFLADESYQKGARAIFQNKGNAIVGKSSYHYFDGAKDKAPKLTYDGKAATNRLVVTFTNKNTQKEETIKGDLLVYALGQQRGQKAAPFLSKELMNKLEPIYDINERFGNAQERVLALQLPDQNPWNNLEIIGAATRQILDGVEINHNYLSRCELVKALTGIQVRIKDRFSVIENCALKYLPDALRPYKDFYALAEAGLKPKVIESQSKHFLGYVTKAVNHYPADDRNKILLTAESLANVFQKCLDTIQYFKDMLGKDKAAPTREALVDALQKIKVTGATNDAAIVKNMPRSIAASAQLVAVKETTAAVQGAIPEYNGWQEVKQVGTSVDPKTGKVTKLLDVKNIKGNTNLSTDDRSMLRVHIAVNYPDIEDCPELTRIMEQIINARREDDRPWGIDGDRFELQPNGKKVPWQTALANLEQRYQMAKALKIH